MSAKLISIFTVAGVIAAGSATYALNTQSLSETPTTQVATSTSDLTKKHDLGTPNSHRIRISTNVSNRAHVDAQSEVGSEVGGGSASLFRHKNQTSTLDDSKSSSDQVNGDVGGPAGISVADAPSAPVLPSPPPGLYPGDDDSQDDGDFQDNSYEDNENDSSVEDQPSMNEDD